MGRFNDERKRPLAAAPYAYLSSLAAQICNRQSVHWFERRWVIERSAECNSAIQQITNLRYFLAFANPERIAKSSQFESLR